ncbi:hypothetical protein KIN20_030195 [Parelaphostrongylus tenuis]|uniref:Uncharacterized protein n=1 Tax=Parelaphostrongylus tenuis TaxID=148309 RepID=A0AAD5R3H2_PARTN|nr:hypothetical protein KIN20_030195 [Parelaphostrongylus tenuis]
MSPILAHTVWKEVTECGKLIRAALRLAKLRDEDHPHSSNNHRLESMRFRDNPMYAQQPEEL